MKTLLITPLLLAWINFHDSTVGIVDVVEERSASLEVESATGILKNFIVPTDIFPCLIKEGDVVYFDHATKPPTVICGESK